MLTTNNINYSIIIPHYNIPRLLERLLKTIPERDDLQVIVVDDCSSEQQRKELEKLAMAFPRVEFYSTEQNSGGGASRNIGMKHAKGKFLIFADADDYFNICFNQALDDYKDSDADIIYFSANSVDNETYENSNRAEFYHRIINDFLTSKDDKKIRYGFAGCVGRFIRREIIESKKIKFEEVRVADDIMFSTLSDFYADKLSADRRAIYCITVRPDSITQSIQSSEKIISHLKTDMWRHNFMREHNVERHIAINYLMMPLKQVYETGNKELIETVEKLFEDNNISVKQLRKLIRNWNRRQIAHNFLKRLHLQRIH